MKKEKRGKKNKIISYFLLILLISSCSYLIFTNVFSSLTGLAISSGNNIWNVSINGKTDGYDSGESIAVDSSGNIYVTGASSWSTPAVNDIYLGKFDSTGKNLWNATLNGRRDNEDIGKDIAVDSSGNIYLVGQSTCWDPCNDWITPDIYLGKFDSTGKNLWNVSINGKTDGYDSGESIAVDSSGNIYALGTSQSSSMNIYLGKFDSTGKNLWNATIDYSGNNDQGYGIAVDSSGNIYVTGYISGSDWKQKIYLGKFDSTGKNLFNTTIENYQGVGNDIAVDSLGNIYLGGFIYGADGGSQKIYLGKFDSTGKNLWSTTLDGIQNNPAIGKGVAVDSSGNIYVTGDIYSGFQSSDPDIYLGKFDSTGKNLWNATLNGPKDSYDGSNDVTLDSFGNIYLTGLSTWSEDSTDIYLGKFRDASSCKEKWKCTSWSKCINHAQTRKCSDLNNCGTIINKPKETKSCGKQQITQTFTGVSPSKPINMIINNSNINLIKMMVELNKKVYTCSLTVKETTALYRTNLAIGLSTNNLYQSFDIILYRISNRDIKNVVVDFRIEKKWIAENQGALKDIRLFRHINKNKWETLSTKLISEDDVYYYFSSISTQF